jgi:hypothetical protein
MKTRLALVVAALGISLPLSPLAAQAHSALLTPGQRVRVYLPASEDFVRTATLVALTGDSIVVERIPSRAAGGQAGSAAGRTALPLGAVGRLEASRGLHRHPIGGFYLGAALGAMAALLVGGCHGETAGNWHCPQFAYTFFPAVALGTVAGFLIRVERWEEVPLDEVRQLRVGLGAALSF